MRLAAAAQPPDGRDRLPRRAWPLVGLRVFAVGHATAAGSLLRQPGANHSKEHALLLCKQYGFEEGLARVGWLFHPIFASFSPNESPACPFSTMKQLTPPAPLPPPPVRAITRYLPSQVVG